MSDWRVAKCIDVFRKEINAEFPTRSKESDGTIGDAAHAARASDHDPNSHGVVTAWDITTDVFTDALAEWLRMRGGRGDRRIKYVIYKRHITSAEHGWQWVAYHGESPHLEHIHLSVSADPDVYDSTKPWGFKYPEKAPSSPVAGTNTTVECEDTMKLVYAPQRATVLLTSCKVIQPLTAAQVAAFKELKLEEVHISTSAFDVIDGFRKDTVHA